MELKKSIYRLPSDDPELIPWAERLADLLAAADPVDQLLMDIEATQPDGTRRDPMQLELFSTLLTELQGMRRRAAEDHRVTTSDGVSYAGTWEEIVLQMKTDDPYWARRPIGDYMVQAARRGQAQSGVAIPVTDAESFVRGSEAAGLLTIVK